MNPRLDAALAHMLSDAESDEFAQLFDTYKEERRLGSPLWSASDAASFVVKSKEAFDDQELAIVALLPGNPYDLVSFDLGRSTAVKELRLIFQPKKWNPWP